MSGHERRRMRTTPCRHCAQPVRYLGAGIYMGPDGSAACPAQPKGLFGFRDVHEATACSCCLGDPEMVCAGCGSHACWAGQLMCEDGRMAGSVRREVSR